MPVILAFHRIVTSSITAPYDWPRKKVKSLFATLDQAGFSSCGIAESLEKPLPAKSFAICSDDGYDSDAWLGEFCMDSGMPLTLFINPATLGQLGFLTCSALRDLANSGVAIGSHSFDHINLAALRGEELMSQLSTSRARLESLVSREVTLLAYPWGRYNLRTISSARNCGYLGAFTARDGSLSRRNRFQVPRVVISAADTVHSVVVRIERARCLSAFEALARNSLGASRRSR